MKIGTRKTTYLDPFHALTDTTIISHKKARRQGLSSTK